MIIVPVKNANSIEQAIKIYKSKVQKTKQNEILRENKEFTKKSVKKRNTHKNAIYKQKNQLGS
jgi:small subunit ribosomal protein S21